MRSTLGNALAFALLATYATAAPASTERRATLAPLTQLGASANTTGGYIIVLKDDTPSVQDVIGQLALPAKNGLSVSAMGVHNRFETVLKGWSGKFDQATLQKIRADPRVAYVEPETVVKASITQTGSTYGLGISSQQKKVPYNQQGNYYWKAPGGRGVTAYVVDTGIYAEHSDFGGRAKMVANFIPNAPSNTDDHGHGTHCAGTIGGKTYGIAKNVNLAGVKVLDYTGYGTNGGVISGINFAVRHCGGAKCVISMSLGGEYSSAVNQAVDNAIRAGVPVIVAAGNYDVDSCSGSPAGAPNAVTVGAIDFAYQRADFSNWGKCLDVFAPGVDVESTWIGDPQMTHYLSGTSMATPHVAGIAAYYLASGRATASNLTQVLINNSQKNIVIDPKGSPNRVANNGFWLP